MKINHFFRTLTLAAFYVCLCQNANAAILFDGEWDDFGKYFEGAGTGVIHWQADHRPSHWHAIQEKEMGRITVENDITSPKHGAVARIEVRPGDNLGWTGERAEVSDMLRKNPTTGRTEHYCVHESDGHEFYGIAVKLSEDWQPPKKNNGNGPLWGIFLQLHGPNNFDAPPPFALAVDSDFHVNLGGGDLLDGGRATKRLEGKSYAFSDGSLHRGHWVQFMIDVTWSYNDHGHVVIYRRDEGETSFRKMLEKYDFSTLQSQYGTPEDSFGHYWKAGFYRSITAGLTNILWLGPLVRGTDFDEVAKVAFGTP